MESNTQPKVDLLIPRFKVKRSWPNMGKIKVGNIICIPDIEAIEEMRNMDHLFKEMEWWEDRSGEIMPEFVVVICDYGNFKKGQVIFVDRWEYHNRYTKAMITIDDYTTEVNVYWTAIVKTPIGIAKYHAQEVRPATEREIKNLKTK